MARGVVNRTRISTESLETMGAAALASAARGACESRFGAAQEAAVAARQQGRRGQARGRNREAHSHDRRSKSLIGWERTKDVVQELDHLRETIAGQLASQDLVAAVERMW
jgi:hypothetical protein